MDESRSRSQARRLAVVGVPHRHREHVPGCFRCELGEDEVEVSLDPVEVSLDPAVYPQSRFDADHRALD